MEARKKAARANALTDAKARLMVRAPGSDLSMFELLVKTVQEIVRTNPERPVEMVEDIIRQIRTGHFVSKSDMLVDDERLEEVMHAAKREVDNFAKVRQLVTNAAEDDLQSDLQDAVPNVMDNAALFHNAGIGLGEEEMYRIFVHLKLLSTAQKWLEKVRFWGKIFGLYNDYIVAECTLREGAEDLGEESEFAASEEEEDVPDVGVPPAEGDRISPGGEDGEGGNLENAPKEVHVVVTKKFKEPVPIPPEAARSGANLKIYFVCNEPGEDWVRLPEVTPQQISAARKIKKYLTGDLRAPLTCYPPYPGMEVHYLRAQIARITAATTLCPVGFYGQPEEEDEDDGQTPLEPSEEYDPPPTEDLCENLSSWVHCARHILPQGRCTWFNPVPDVKEDFEDGDDDEDDASRDSGEGAEPLEPEMGPAILTPIANDKCSSSATEVWSIRRSWMLFPQHSHAVVSNNLWPGAHTAGNGIKFESVYIGYGHKYEAEQLNPAMPPIPRDEYREDGSIMEVSDPSPEDEAAAARANADDDEDGEGEGEEEEEEEEEEDD